MIVVARKGVQQGDKIIALYARGMSVRDTQAQLQEMYGIEVSPTLISNVTDAVMAFNILSTVKSALKEVHGVEKIDANLSSYYVVKEVQSNFRGMAIAIESEEWFSFSQMTVITFADMLRAWAGKVNLNQKSP